MHELHRITEVRVVGDSSIEVTFEDGLCRTIDLGPILVGTMFGPLKDPELFRQVRVDPEVHTIVWPNGADFDPETLHNWPDYERAWIERAQSWKAAAAR